MRRRHDDVIHSLTTVVLYSDTSTDRPPMGDACRSETSLFSGYAEYHMIWPALMQAQQHLK